MQYEVVEHRDHPGEWVVEAIDHDREGEIYGAVFYGPDAQDRAEEYAAWKQSVDLDKRFLELVKRWKKETVHLSLATRMAIHPAYREIVAMGWPAVPLLLSELHKRADHWFIALEEITGENPVPPESEGKVKKMAEAWIQWGRHRGHIK